MSHVVRRLRLHLFAAGGRTSRLQCFPSSAALHTVQASVPKAPSHDYEKRVAQLQEQVGIDRCYPRLPSSFVQQHGWDTLNAAEHKVEVGETLQDGQWRNPVVLAGRVRGIRTAGSKLVFIDVAVSNGSDRTDVQGQSRSVQAVYQLSKIDASPEAFKRTVKLMRPGDSYMFTGRPHRTPRGEFSLQLVELPQLLSPSLHQIPEVLDDAETRARNRHVDMLVNSEAIQTLRVRAGIESCINDFFQERGFVKVTTPIMSAGAGGAVARPFETEATELQGQKLHMRIAPELWLKRLIVGGLDKVYEIGPSFRNEGVDGTHNPEFTTCEFYEAYATLDSLINATCSLLRGLAEHFPSSRLRAEDVSPDARLDFLPTLERLLQQKLPDLEALDAADHMLQFCRHHEVPIPASPSLPRLLDALSSHFLEPRCEQPTFIVNHPACMSPLSKHYRCEQTGQLVAARAELFIHRREYANMYEEENSPFEQRRKFEEQLRYRAVDGESDGNAEVDHSYLEALEWGMPPTGGWGCGIDRLVMLLSGRDRIADVLSFGSLRTVVGLSKGRH